MILKRLSFEEFKDEFKRYSRENQFSEDGLKELYQLLNDEDQKLEILDVIKICSEYSELTIAEYQEYYHTREDYIKLKNGNILINV